MRISTPFPLGELAGLGVRADVEPDDERVGGGREVDVVRGDPADVPVDDVDADLGVLDLRELVERRLERALHVGLEHEPQLLQRARLHLARTASRARRRASHWRRRCSRAQPLGPHLGEVARLAVVLDHAAELAGGGGLSKPMISTGSPGRASLIFSPR